MSDAKNYALQIMTDLPTDTAEALQALEYARELVLWRASEGGDKAPALRVVDFTRPPNGAA